MSIMDNSQIINTLRSCAADAMRKHLYSTAIFMANKLITLKHDVQDVVLLAQAYYLTQQYRRAITVLKGYLDVCRECRYLAAKCKAKCEEWEDCLELIAEHVIAAVPKASIGIFSTPGTQSIDVDAAICVLRGEAYEALDLRPKAIYWYKQALRHDIFCYEAFERLIEGSMLTYAEEIELLNSLHFTEENKWLEELYRTKLKMFSETVSGQEFDKLYESLSLRGLADNDDVIANQAESLFYCNQHAHAYQLTSRVLERDPHNYGHVRVVHISCLVELGLKNELFYMAHTMIEENPKLAISWYAVGCYYYCISDYQNARRYLSKATTINHNFGPAWLAFGHTFAMNAEHDQAMAAYRTAARLLVGSHIPLVSIATELIRAGNFPLATEFLEKSLKANPNDPLVYNQLGVIALESKEYHKAVALFNKTLHLCLHRPHSTSNSVGSNKQDDNDMDTEEELSTSDLAIIGETWEPTLFNLGHCYRKLRLYDKAIKYYSLALSVHPNNPSALLALGFSHHLSGNLTEAIDYYHQALGLQPDETLASQLLETALREQMHEMPLDEVVNV